MNTKNSVKLPRVEEILLGASFREIAKSKWAICPIPSLDETLKRVPLQEEGEPERYFETDYPDLSEPAYRARCRYRVGKYITTRPEYLYAPTQEMGERMEYLLFRAERGNSPDLANYLHDLQFCVLLRAGGPR